MLFAIAVALAGPAAGSKPSELRALLEDASVARRLEAWPELNLAVRERSLAALGPETFALLSREVEAAFAAPRLVERVELRLSGAGMAGLREGYAASGAAGLLGDARGIPAQELRDFPRFASQVSRRELPPARFALVARIDESTGFSRDAWRVTSAWGRALERGTRALRCEGPSAWRVPLAPDASLAEPFRERVHVELLFLTRELEIAQLRRAVRWLGSEPARAFERALHEASGLALEQALGELRERLEPLVRERCS